jgi:hypothetical protein
MAANGTTFTAPSVKSYKAMIESEDIADISGRTNANSLIRLLNELATGVQGIECGYSQFGYLHLCLP